MFYSFPHNFLFWTKVENHEDIKNHILPQIYQDEAELSKSSYEDSITSYFEKKDSTQTIIERYFKQIIWDPLDKMLDSEGLNISVKPTDSKISNAWYNIYRGNNNWHRTHTHPRSTFSGIYLLHLEGKNTTQFLQTGHTLFDWTKETDEIGEGNVIIFPSSLLHTVAPTTDHKVSISFNISSSHYTLGSLT